MSETFPGDQFIVLDDYSGFAATAHGPTTFERARELLDGLDIDVRAQCRIIRLTPVAPVVDEDRAALIAELREEAERRTVSGETRGWRVTTDLLTRAADALEATDA